MLDKHAYLRYCYDWSWWSWWSRWSHNTVSILSWFTLFQKHYRWKTHSLSTTFHIGLSERIKSIKSHLRSWVTLLPFWTLHVIKKNNHKWFKRKKKCENVLSLASQKHNNKTQVWNDPSPALSNHRWGQQVSTQTLWGFDVWKYFPAHLTAFTDEQKQMSTQHFVSWGLIQQAFLSPHWLLLPFSALTTPVVSRIAQWTGQGNTCELNSYFSGRLFLSLISPLTQLTVLGTQTACPAWVRGRWQGTSCGTSQLKSSVILVAL